jgi:class 3 adenylate cyclase
MYLAPAADSTLPEPQYPFSDTLEIGRLEEGREVKSGLLLLPSASVSWRHCIIRQAPEGRCYVRDVSRNGTRLDGRRLVPNVETEIRVGQTLELGPGMRLTLGGESTTDVEETSAERKRTDLAPHLAIATVLVGDIRNYTVMVRKAEASELQQSVSRVFEVLTASVEEHGGTMKEFPGDAVLAFWEGSFRGEQAVSACRAVIGLDRLSRQIAADPSIWTLRKFPLEMDWALATGSVSIDSFGGDTPIGLSVVGEPIVLACRLEKFANKHTGRILMCPATHKMVARTLSRATSERVEFVDLGEMQAKGFDHPDQVFALRVEEP